MHPMLNIAVRAARAAGTVIVRGFEKQLLKLIKKQNKQLLPKFSSLTRTIAS